MADVGRGTRVLAALLCGLTFTGCGADKPLPEKKSVDEEKAEAEARKNAERAEKQNELPPRVSATNKTYTSEFEPDTVHFSGPISIGRVKYDPKAWTVKLDLQTQPKTKLKVGDSEATANAEGKASFTLDLGKAFLKALPSAYAGKQSLAGGVPFSVMIDGPFAKPFNTVIHAEFRALFSDWLAKTPKGPWLSPGEKAVPQSRETAVLGWGKLHVVGVTDVKWPDVDVIARKVYRERKKTCGPYVDPATKASKSIDMTVNDVDVVLYDRRSGEQFANRLFKATSKCPKQILKERKSSSAFVDDKKVVRWVGKKLNAPQPGANRR